MPSRPRARALGTAERPWRRREASEGGDGRHDDDRNDERTTTNEARDLNKNKKISGRRSFEFEHHQVIRSISGAGAELIQTSIQYNFHSS